MSVKFLKVKIKSLAVEAKIIKLEERKAKQSYRYHKSCQGHEEQYETALDTFWGLRFHRKNEVGPEARASHLAYAFIRNRSYLSTEASPDLVGYLLNGIGIHHEGYYKNLLTRIARLATKYGLNEVSVDDIETWILKMESVSCEEAA